MTSDLDCWEEVREQLLLPDLDIVFVSSPVQTSVWYDMWVQATEEEEEDAS